MRRLNRAFLRSAKRGKAIFVFGAPPKVIFTLTSGGTPPDRRKLRVYNHLEVDRAPWPQNGSHISARRDPEIPLGEERAESP